MLLYHLGQCHEVDILKLLSCKLLYSFFLVVTLTAAPAVIHILTLVVATPHRYGAMVAQTAHIVDGLLAYVGEKLLVGRISRAGKHEVLPYHDAVLVAEIIQAVILVDSSAPYTYHIHVHILGVKHMLEILLRRDARQEVVHRHHARSFGEHRLAVELEIQTVTPVVGLVYQLKRPYAQTRVLRLHFLAVDTQRRGEFCQIRLAQTVAPPQPRIFHRIVKRHLVEAFLQTDTLRCHFLAVGRD